MLIASCIVIRSDVSGESRLWQIYSFLTSQKLLWARQRYKVYARCVSLGFDEQDPRINAHRCGISTRPAAQYFLSRRVISRVAALAARRRALPANRLNFCAG